MRFGPKCEDGFLPVFSTNTEEEARRLIVLTCKGGPDGNYYAPDLLGEQTLDNLAAFSDRLQRGWDFMHKIKTPAEPPVKKGRK